MTRREWMNAPVRTNPAGLVHLYEGDEPPWEIEGPFQFGSESDEMRHRALRHENRAIDLRTQAAAMDGAA
ncbi:hypothetical protein V5738_11030 [Salinisphaera sp. SPP-AMP-43]|uniref:hypothetical protein n=1 Tax=Salinisphaera sp. SPP-AMP-43 TaxID=3121288 RepID=UPI003C6E76D4